MAVWPMEARPIPKPAIPCSVRGVLNTRSRPVSVELGWWGLGGRSNLPNSSARPWREREGERTDDQQRWSTDHGAPEDTTESNILSKDHSIVVLGQCDARRGG